MNRQSQWLFEASFVSESDSDTNPYIDSEDHTAVHVTLLISFSKQGFGTTKDFRDAWFAINKAFLKVGRVWTAALFREDFCKTHHYEMNIAGVGVKRFAVVRGFPVLYEERKDKEPLLVDIGNRGARGANFISTLEKKGRSVKPPLRCKPSSPKVPTPGGSAPISSIIIEPQPGDYADMAREILRKRNRNQGIVLSVVQMMPADGKGMIDIRTERGKWRQRLKNPPAHVVMPAEVYEIKWKRMKLRYVWILSNEKSKFPVGGMLFLPLENQLVFYLVTFNVGALDDGKCTNVHHAEMQAVRWIEEQSSAWRKRVGAIAIWNLSRKTGLGYSPCNPCCFDLARFLKNLRALGPATAARASITWLTHYDKNKACGHPTNIDNLRRLASSGWILNGPGWPSRQSPVSTTSPRVRTV